MRLCVSLCVAVLFLFGFELVRTSDEEMSEIYDYVTPTPDYDYNATFDYYYVTEAYHPENHEPIRPRGQATTLSHLTSILLVGLVVGYMI